MDPSITDPAEGRRYDHRVEVELKAVVQVPLDDGDSVYLKGKAEIVNVSPMGVCVHIAEMKEAHTAILSGPDRECSVVCELPDTKESVFLSGKVAWVDIGGEGEHRTARLGVHLTDTPYKEHGRLLRYLDRVTKPVRPNGGAVSE